MSGRRTVQRGGLYYCVAAPDWIDPADTRYSKERGGRWNPVGECCPKNDRTTGTGHIQNSTVKALDACTPKGIAALGFAKNFPFGVPLPPCQAIARAAHVDGLAGIASRSNAEATAIASVGEELALFEEIAVGAPIARRKFREWYPDPIPG